MLSGLPALLVLKAAMHLLPAQEDLASVDVQLTVAPGPAAMQAHLQQDPGAVCVLDATHLHGRHALMLVQMRQYAKGGVLAITLDTPESRVQAYLLGADLCIAQNSPAHEYAAAALALRRRLRTIPGPAPYPEAGGVARNGPRSPPEVAHGPWSLVDEGWRLIAPNGSASRLSSNERGILLALGSRPGSTMSREEIAAALSADSRDVQPVSINMMVSRLRAKARQTGMELPLGVIAGHGYVLEAPLQMDAPVAAKARGPSSAS